MDGQKWKKSNPAFFPLLTLRMVWGACDKIIKLISARAHTTMVAQQNWHIISGETLIRTKLFQSNCQISIGAGRQWLRPHLSSHPSIGRLFPGITHMRRESKAYIYGGMAHTQIVSTVCMCAATLLLSGLEYICTTVRRLHTNLNLQCLRFESHQQHQRERECRWR